MPVTEVEVEVRSLEDAAAHIRSLVINQCQLAGRVRTLEKMLDTKDAPWWKRVLWRLDGFPPWYRVGSRSWRPWRRRS